MNLVSLRNLPPLVGWSSSLFLLRKVSHRGAVIILQFAPSRVDIIPVLGILLGAEQGTSGAIETAVEQVSVGS